jgi:hypothetical protein
MNLKWLDSNLPAAGWNDELGLVWQVGMTANKHYPDKE